MNEKHEVTKHNLLFNSHMNADTPLENPPNDQLNRSQFSRYFANTIADMPADESFVFALNGTWGSGKTTVKNFVVRELEARTDTTQDMVIFHFNPWWFPDREALLRQFFAQFRAVILNEPDSKHLQHTGELLGELGKLLEPFEWLPGGIGDAAKSGRKVAEWSSKIMEGKSDETKPLDHIRKRLDDLLLQQSTRFLVIIDDIDRLESDEIREIFRLVKAVGNFPRTMYLLLFDRSIVARALTGVQDDTGELYLDKVVQLAFDLPILEDPHLSNLFFNRIDQTLIEKTPDELRNEAAFQVMYWFGVRGFIRTPRDLTRLVNSFNATYPAVCSEVFLSDYLGVEALRVFANDLYRVLSRNKALITGNYLPLDGGLLLYSDDNKLEERFRKAFDSALEKVPEDVRKPAVNVMKQLVPCWTSKYEAAMGAQFQGQPVESDRYRRLAGSDAFDVYFRFGLAQNQLAYAEIQEALSLSDDPRAFGNLLLDYASATDDDGRPRLRPFLARLDDFTGEGLSDYQIQGMLQAILDRSDEILQVIKDRDWSRFGEFSMELYLLRAVRRLLHQVRDQIVRFRLLLDNLNKSASISFPAYLVKFFGQEHGRHGGNDELQPSERTFSSSQVHELENLTTDRLRRAADDGSLSQLPNLASVILVWSKFIQTNEPTKYAQQLLATDQGLIAYLASCMWLQPPDVRSKQAQPVWKMSNGYLGYLKEVIGDHLTPIKEKCKRIIQSKPGQLDEREYRAINILIPQ